MHIIGYYDHGTRSQYLVNAALQGARAYGHTTGQVFADNYNGGVDGDAAIFYGLRGKLHSIFKTYKKEGKKAIFIDLGFWGRCDGGKLHGYHRVSVNEYYPYEFVKQNHLPGDRIAKFNLVFEGNKYLGEHILLAGMSGKAAGISGYAASEYERAAIEQIKSLTDLPIIYRPKPSWRNATELPGATTSPPDQPLFDVLTNAAVVVTHHSNVALDGLVMGIPCVVHAACAAQLLGTNTIRGINNMPHPSLGDRQCVFNALGYAQFKPDEFRSGEFFDTYAKLGWLR